MRQVDTWRRWVAYERDDDPLALKTEDLPSYHARVLHVYTQAIMALRFWPEIWYEAAEFCFSQNLDAEGLKFLQDGSRANPESCLLAFKLADRIEGTTTAESGDDSIKERGDKVRKPYNELINALYCLLDKFKARQDRLISDAKANAARQLSLAQYDGDDEEAAKQNSEALAAQIQTIEGGNGPQILLLRKTITHSWICLMRAMRRVQGQGKPGEAIGGSRQVFSDARKRGQVTSDVYIASALIEYHCYKDPVATKIFERGVKLFPYDEQFVLAYLKHLIATNDVTSKAEPLLAHDDSLANSLCRCSVSLREKREPTRLKATASRPGQTNLRILLPLRGTVWRAQPSAEAGEAHA